MQESNRVRPPSALPHAAADRWEWLDVIRRARLGRTTKAVAVMLATYADRDGTHIFPGVARLALVCEIGYNTVQKSLAELRTAGFIERVYHSGKAGRADEYQLIIGPDVRVPTPAEFELMVHRKRKPWGGPPRPTGQGEVDSEPHPTARGEVETAEKDTSPHGANGSEDTSPHGVTTPHPTAWVDTSHGHEHLTTTSHIAAAVHTDLEVVGDLLSGQDPIFGEEEKPRLRLVTDIRRGLGFCVECYANGQTVLAADPESGSECASHLREAS